MTQMLTLERYCYSDRMGVFGRVLDLPFELHTVEQPWRGNKPFESCIPEGVYDLVPVESPRFGRTLALESRLMRVFATQADAVQSGDRYACLLHAGNRAAELQGCIAPGLVESVAGHEWAVGDSRAALAELLKYVTIQRIKTILITHYWPQYP